MDELIDRVKLGGMVIVIVTTITTTITTTTTATATQGINSIKFL